MAKMSADELLERYAEGERDFEGADLSGADLRLANLTGADLTGANLSRADLSHADLRGAHLTDTGLMSAKLSGAKLSGADLTGANLSRADLMSADLIRTNLSGARLGRADFFSANLVGANLVHANLVGTNLYRASLSGIEPAGVKLGGTLLLDIVATPFCDLEVRVEGPCEINWRTVAKSLRAPGLHDFMVRCGVPDVFATYMIDCARSIDEVSLFTMLQSTFISYGGPDEPFAQRLHEALERNGVKTWFFPRDAIPGEKLHREMWRGVNSYDRVILICSRASLVRPGVLNELERVVEREASEGGSSVLIPIRIDDFVFSEWAPDDRGDLKRQIETRVVADFRGAMDDESKFNDALGKLLLALKKRSSD